MPSTQDGIGKTVMQPIYEVLCCEVRQYRYSGTQNSIGVNNVDHDVLRKGLSNPYPDSFLPKFL